MLRYLLVRVIVNDYMFELHITCLIDTVIVIIFDVLIVTRHGLVTLID